MGEVSVISLRAVAISVTYRSGIFSRRLKTVLEDVSLKIEEGETVGLVGNSGSGKTTLGKIMAGLKKPSSGRILFKGEDVAKMSKGEFSKFRKQVQMVFQDPEGSLNPRKTIGQSLEEVLSLIGTPKWVRRDKTLDMLGVVGLPEELLSRYPGQLSGGENQRVVIGRVLLLEPEFVILDEPTSALDISVQAQMLNLLKRLQKDRGMGYLFISHDMESVRFMAKQIGIVADGHLLVGGSDIDDYRFRRRSLGR